MYQDTGLYRNQQYAKASTVLLQTMYEEIPILWDQEMKYRPSFSAAGDTVTPAGDLPEDLRREGRQRLPVLAGHQEAHHAGHGGDSVRPLGPRHGSQPREAVRHAVF